jgi:phospholipid transport system substrate-binding protein
MQAPHDTVHHVAARRMRRRVLLPIPALAALAPLRAARAQAPSSPTEVVEQFHAALLAVMREAGRLGVRGRYARLRPAMEAAFDLPAMARIAVGPPWTRMTPEQQAMVVDAFAEWSIATYANRFDGFSGERFVTDGETALQRGDRLVRTTLHRPRGEPVQLNYLLRPAEPGGRWRIVDVYLTGTISELASRRSEFTALLREGGADRLVAELRRRTGELMRG